MSQTVMLSALAVCTDPLAVDAAAESMTARNAATMIRAFISPPEGVGAPGRSHEWAPIGLVHRPRRGDWHSPHSLSSPISHPVWKLRDTMVLTTDRAVCFPSRNDEAGTDPAPS